MNLLCRVTYFEDIDDAKCFFEQELQERDDSHFYAKKDYRKLEDGDSIYFIYDNYIVAQAIFTGDKHLNKDRDEEFVHGHKLRDIKIVNSTLKIDTKKNIFHDMKYIDSVELNINIKNMLK